MSREVVPPLERLRAVRARVLPLIRVERGEVLLQELVLRKRTRPRWAERAGEAPPDGVLAVLGQQVVAVAALGEGAGLAADGAAEAVAQVRPEMLVQVRLGLEDLGALGALVVPGVAVPDVDVLLEL